MSENNQNKRKNVIENSSKSKTMKLSILSSRFGKDFFNKPCLDLAKDLLGKVLVRRLDNGSLLKGYIVEMEAYPGGDDKASSSHNERRTDANEPLYMNPGTAFVYLTYGMYHCFNISCKEPGGGVFIRALEPIQGLEEMKSKRLEKFKSKPKKLNDNDLCNGPSKLCISMSIDKVTINKIDLCISDKIWVEDDKNHNVDRIVECNRIGIDRAGKEWAGKPWRFYEYGNPNVSVKNKEAELLINGV